jgi:hypothetical protein
VKFEAIIKGEMLMGVAAHNLGGPEAELGAEKLRDIQQRTGVPFVSANLLDSEGQPVTDVFRVIEAGGLRLAVTGVLSDSYESPHGRITKPRQAVLAVLDDLEGQFDELIVLAYLPERELRDFTASLPEADVIIGGPTIQSLPPQQVGPTLLSSATNKGKFITALRLEDNENATRWSGEIVEMGGDYEDEPAQVENLIQYQRVLAERDFKASETGFAPQLAAAAPHGFEVVGTASCRACHEADSKVWDGSKHAMAWHTLEVKNSHVDPYCQQCHTTGYGLPGGFQSVSLSASRTSVGCESCHGPSVEHVKDPNVRTSFAAGDQCIRCHDRDNSPSFDYRTYWPRIVHGQKTGTEETVSWLRRHHVQEITQ